MLTLLADANLTFSNIYATLHLTEHRGRRFKAQVESLLSESGTQFSSSNVSNPSELPQLKRSLVHAAFALLQQGLGDEWFCGSSETSTGNEFKWPEDSTM